MIEHFKDKLKELTELSKEDVGYNENNVKYHFIIPLLECFGHNRLDFEHSAQTNRIDIYIKQSEKHSSCGFVIEAKNYDKNLDEYLIQLQKYSDIKRPLLAIISNGEEIRFYDPSWRGVPFSESLLYSIKRIDLNNDEIIERLEKLFSKENLNNELLHDYIDEREKEIKDAKREIESLTKEYKSKEEEISKERKILEEEIKKLKEKNRLPIIVPPKIGTKTRDITDKPILDKGETQDSEVIEIYANYKRQLYKATYYSPHKIVFNGKDYTSPSAACMAVINRQCNGWTFWKYKDETGNEQLLDKLRQRIVPPVIDTNERDIPESQEKPNSDRGVTQDSKVSEIFANYRNQLYKATYYSPHKIVFNGKDYTSPSAACMAVINRQCNGWTFWKFKDETGNEQLLDKLRQRIIQSKIDTKERDIPESREKPTSDRDITQDSKARRIYANYKRQLYKATYYSPHKIVFNGKDYASPSAAGTAVTNKPCSGWTFWKFKDETGNEQLLDKLRQS